MASVYTIRVAHANGTGPGDVLLYTVPAGRRIILRDIVSFRTTGTVPLTIYVTPGSAGQPYTVQYATASGGYDHLQLRQAIEAGDTLRLNTGGTAYQVTVTGYDFPV